MGHRRKAHRCQAGHQNEIMEQDNPEFAFFVRTKIVDAEDGQQHCQAIERGDQSNGRLACAEPGKENGQDGGRPHHRRLETPEGFTDDVADGVVAFAGVHVPRLITDCRADTIAMKGEFTDDAARKPFVLPVRFAPIR